MGVGVELKTKSQLRKMSLKSYSSPQLMPLGDGGMGVVCTNIFLHVGYDKCKRPDLYPRDISISGGCLSKNRRLKFVFFSKKSWWEDGGGGI